MEATSSSETSVTNYQMTWYNFPEHLNLHVIPVNIPTITCTVYLYSMLHILIIVLILFYTIVKLKLMVTNDLNFTKRLFCICDNLL